ncbi:hypothetical protein CALCODRAFT_494478 [Calocera cornea HHB12733]|uniref:Cyclase n=1 Tax=Calocera cornea HHB12733 TaxID=1353952 RepID=A0A165H284_9BASI|nr:hypothetical protein CALCODRAFT_494478 [Calocera cornea HHB12733]
MMKRPSFKDLPLGKDDPPYSAWGLYGPKDELGALNLLTEEVVKKAAEENIKTGVRISLNLPLDVFKDKPFFNRQVFHKDLYPKPPRNVNDDVWHFNTQSSSQWDGLRHFGYQAPRKLAFYNGVTMDDIHAEGSTVNGIHAWSDKGIVGRGVLLDFDTWRRKEGIEYDPFKTSPIPLKYLKQIAEAQGITFRSGDILLTRTGCTKTYLAMSPEERVQTASPNPVAAGGVEQSEEMVEWLWENEFAAVGGDQPSFEAWPTQWKEKDFLALHEVILSGWGMPLGEFFNLEELAEHCQKTGRYTFFVVSEPCNVIGGVASPPNILAIF